MPRLKRRKPWRWVFFGVVMLVAVDTSQDILNRSIHLNKQREADHIIIQNGDVYLTAPPAMTKSPSKEPPRSPKLRQVR